MPNPEHAYDDEDDLDPLDDADLEDEDEEWDESEWDEIIATTEEDFQAGRYAFNSADYATHEEAWTALEKWLREICEEAIRDADAICAHHASSEK